MPKNKVEAPAVHRKGLQGKDKREFGDKAKHDHAFNCLSCKRFSICHDPSKSWNYRCTKWSELPVIDDIAPAQLAIEAPKKAVGTALERIKKKEYTELQLEEIINNALNSEYGSMGNITVDDREVPTPPNFYTWFTDPAFAGQPDFHPWSMQLKLTTEYLGEWCPRCSDQRYMANPNITHDAEQFADRVTFLEKGVCPKCKATKSELTLCGELENYYQSAWVIGQRSGKTYLSTAISAYNAALWLKLPSPQAVYGLPSQQILTATYVSLTYQQAKENIWDPFYNWVDGSAWFKEYHEVLNYYGEKSGEELYALKNEFLRYRHKNMLWHPMGPNKRTLRGKTRHDASIDEPGWFAVSDDQDTKERAGGPEVLTALQRSMKTLVAKHRKLLTKKGLNHLPKPLLTLISSPQEINDLIMSQFRASENSKKIYGIKRATWDFNPELPRSEFDEEFKENADKAMRDFGAEPPLSSNSWISDMGNAVQVFSGRGNNAMTRQKRFSNPNSGIKQTTANVKVKNHANGARVLAIDAGYVNNSFAFCVGTLQDGIPVIESMGEIMPTSKAPASFNAIYRDALLPLIQDSGVQIMVSDRWQNIKMMQDLEAETGAFPVEYRVKYPDFDALREAIYDDAIILPKLEEKPESIFTVGEEYPSFFESKPALHLLYQMLSVRDYPGQTVEKGGKVTDDLFRCVVLCHSILTDADYVSMLNDGSRRGARPMGVMIPRGTAAMPAGTVVNKMGAVRSGSQAGGGTVTASGGGSSRTGSIGVMAAKR